MKYILSEVYQSSIQAQVPSDSRMLCCSCLLVLVDPWGGEAPFDNELGNQLTQ